MALHQGGYDPSHPAAGVEDLKTKQHVENFVRQRLDLPQNLKQRIAHQEGDLQDLKDRVTALETWRTDVVTPALTALGSRLDTIEATIPTLATVAEFIDLEDRVDLLETNIPPQVHVYRTTDFTVPKSVLTPIPFGSERYDDPDGDQHSTSTNSERLTAHRSFLALLVGHGEWEPITAAGGVQRRLEIRRNGTDRLDAVEVPPVVSATSQLALTAVAVIRATPNDYFELCAFHDHPTLDLKVLYKADYSADFSMTSLGNTS